MIDAQEFEAFVRKYQDMVYATAGRLLGNPTEAEDVAQVVFLRAFQRFDAIGSSPTAGGWLKAVTRNACLNHLSRYRARWQFFSEIQSAMHGIEAESYEGSLPDDSLTAKMEQAELREQLERALRVLPDHQRVPLVLFHFEQASYQEIAEALGVSIGKVKTDIHRGREALKPLLRLLQDASR
jgi:RNA polymerase sigma-70 factor (ECF subfamily)